MFGFDFNFKKLNDNVIVSLLFEVSLADCTRVYVPQRKKYFEKSIMAGEMTVKSNKNHGLLWAAKLDFTNDFFHRDSQLIRIAHFGNDFVLFIFLKLNFYHNKLTACNCCNHEQMKLLSSFIQFKPFTSVWSLNTYVMYFNIFSIFHSFWSSNFEQFPINFDVYNHYFMSGNPSVGKRLLLLRSTSFKKWFPKQYLKWW